MHPLAEAAPVLGADGRVHLAYELAVANQTMFRPSGDSTGPTLRPGESGYLFLDSTLAPDAPPPGLLRHRFALHLQDPQAPEDLGPRDTDPAPAPPRTLEFTGVPVAVSAQQAVPVASPLRGPGWVAANDCCDAGSSRSTREGSLAATATSYRSTCRSSTSHDATPSPETATGG